MLLTTNFRRSTNFFSFFKKVSAITSLTLLSSMLFAQNICNERTENSPYTYSITTCHENGLRLLTYEFSTEDDRMLAKISYDNQERIIKRIGFSQQGDTIIQTREYKETSYINTRFMRNDSLKIESKREFDLITNSKMIEWKYEGGLLLWRDLFDRGDERLISVRTILPENMSYLFKYKSGTENRIEIESFKVIDENSIETGSYHYQVPLFYENVLSDLFTGDKLKAVQRQFHDGTRFPVAIIDSGFDLRHPMIVPFLSPFDYRSENSNINEALILGSLRPIPLSHGTHVSSIALKNQASARLMGLSGDVGNPDYLATINDRLKREKVRLANMSWGFKSMGVPFTPSTQAYHELESLIKNNSQTLFHVAAGNNAWDIDGDHKDYPASYRFNNLFVIGALHKSDYKWTNGHDLRPALFKEGAGSNIGKNSVDAFAPGLNVDGALLGGGTIAMSGTSMASPYALNSTIAVANILPSYSALKLKELMMKTVGHVEKGLPCVSQGFIHPKRSIKVATLLSNSEMSLEEAVLLERKNKKDYYPGEVELDTEELKEIWKVIDNSLSINTD